MDAVKFLILTEKMCTSNRENECRECPAYNAENRICKLNYKSPYACVAIVKKWAKDNKVLNLFGRIK